VEGQKIASQHSMQKEEMQAKQEKINLELQLKMYI
jgi:hypothetical protein